MGSKQNEKRKPYGQFFHGYEFCCKWNKEMGEMPKWESGFKGGFLFLLIIDIIGYFGADENIPVEREKMML